MPWTTPALSDLARQANQIVTREFNIPLTAQVSLCSQRELEKRMIEVLNAQNYSTEKIAFIVDHVLPVVLGKYFDDTHEIWIVESKGELVSVIVHEYLHSIQRCFPRREKIVDYLTWKFTDDDTMVSQSLLKDWRDIEKMHGFQAIKRRLIEEGDCEDFP